MENPSLGSVLANNLSGRGGSSSQADPSKDDSNDKVNIAPGVVSSDDQGAGLSRGAMRMEIETWKSGIQAMKGLLDSLTQTSSNTNGQ